MLICPDLICSRMIENSLWVSVSIRIYCRVDTYFIYIWVVRWNTSVIVNPKNLSSVSIEILWIYIPTPPITDTKVEVTCLVKCNS